MPTNTELNKLLKELETRVKVLENASLEVPVVHKIEPAMPAIQDPNNPPVPPVYRKMVDDILNYRFGIKIDYQPNAFSFTVIVPKEYSTLTEEELRMVGADLRSRTISYADGENGVRDWLNLVWMSFNPTAQARIKS